MEDKVIIGTKTFHYEVCIASFLRVNGGAHLKMKSTAKTSYAAAELIFKERDSAILIEFHYKVSLKP